MKKFEEIINLSKEIDQDWTDRKISESFQIVFPVSPNHPRFKAFDSYPLILTSLSAYHFPNDSLIIIDSGVYGRIKKNNDTSTYVSLDPIENKTKTLDFLDGFLEEYRNQGFRQVIAIGGGIVLNACSYVAEKLGLDLILIPTSIVAMSDSSVGGKVRVNDIKDNEFIKHAYKSFYEPSQIIIDPQFLDYLSDEQIRLGLSEIIKHALYQSDSLAQYLLSDEFNPFFDRNSLLKAIMWTADLKRICLEFDPEESQDGSYLILRAAHDISDKMEEESGLTVPHSEAVLEAMKIDLKENPDKSQLLQAIYEKLGIGV